MATSIVDAYSQEDSPDFWQALVVDDTLTPEQREKVSAAFEALTPCHQTILRQRLLSISFVAGLPANAQTMRVDSAGGESAFRLWINTRVLEETLSEFATRKERQLFAGDDSQLTVTIVAGSMDALVFVLLHEATHMVDMALGLTPQGASASQIQEADQTAFDRGVWETAITPAGAYRGETLDSIPWRTGKPLPIESAPALYDELARTPFASVYSSLAIAEDIAELVAWREMTERYGQPYRIEVRDAGELISSYAPMKSSLVRSRLSQLARFDSAQQ